MDFIGLPERKATLWDRVTNAYYAFQMKVAPDIEALFDRLNEMKTKANEEALSLDAKREHAMRNLDGFTKAQIHSVASTTEHWRDIFEQMSMIVEGEAVEDQITIMQYIFASNRNIVTTLRFKQWMTRHADAILDYLPE